MTTTTSAAAIAAEAASHFTTMQRGDETITVTRDGAPEWVTELVHTAHGSDFLPDDWRYQSIRSALDAIEESGADDFDALDDEGAEWADGNVDIYNGRRLAWLASNLGRAEYCDTAAEEMGTGADAGIMDRIALGQYAESREVWELVVSALRDRAEEIEADED